MADDASVYPALDGEGGEHATDSFESRFVDLSPSDAVDYARAKLSIRANLAGALLVGDALLRIRDNKWYRADGYATFESFCRAEYDMSRARAYELLKAAEVIDNLSAIADFSADDGPFIPMNEAQIRPLTRLDACDQPVALVAAARAAEVEGVRLVSRHVEAAVREIEAAKHPAPFIPPMLGESANAAFVREQPLFPMFGESANAAFVREPVFVWREIYLLVLHYRDGNGERTLRAEIETVHAGNALRYTASIGGEHQSTHITRAEAVRWVEERFRASAGLLPTTTTTPLGGVKP